MSAPMIGTTGPTRQKSHHAVSIKEETMKAPTDNKETSMMAEKSEMKSTDNRQNKFAVLNQKTNDEQYWDNRVADIMRRVRQAIPAGKAPALPIGTIQAEEPGSPLLAVTAGSIDYVYEFEDVELGLVAPRATSATPNYIGEFEDLEAGR